MFLCGALSALIVSRYFSALDYVRLRQELVTYNAHFPKLLKLSPNYGKYINDALRYDFILTIMLRNKNAGVSRTGSRTKLHNANVK